MFTINKKIGETPLEALERVRIRKGIGKDIPMTYAGRLDPLAEGKLIILVGDECKKKEEYLGLDKEYVFEVLFGFSTDTYDTLGKIIYSIILTNYRIDNGENELVKKIKQNLKFFKGKIIQKYPMYSSKTVDGKPLFAYAREGSEVDVPEREIQIYDLRFEGIKSITSKKLLQDITERIKKLGPANKAGTNSRQEGSVKKDFRQGEILEKWKEELDQNEQKFFIAKFKIKCSSGTYVRTIANDLGQKLDIPALAYSIKRTRIGEF